MSETANLQESNDIKLSNHQPDSQINQTHPQLDAPGYSSSHDFNKPQEQLPQDEKNRLFLMRCVMCFILLSLIIYLIRGDIAVLGLDTIIASAAYLIFKYYFTRNDKK